MTQIHLRPSLLYQKLDFTQFSYCAQQYTLEKHAI